LDQIVFSMSPKTNLLLLVAFQIGFLLLIFNSFPASSISSDKLISSLHIQTNQSLKNHSSSQNHNPQHNDNDDDDSQNPQQPHIIQKQFVNPLRYEQIISPNISKETYFHMLEIFCVAYDENHLNLIVRDANHVQYEIPYEEPYPHPKNTQYLDITKSNFEFVPQTEPFDILVRRRDTQEVIFKLTDRFVFTSLYIEFSFLPPTKEIYGLGARLSPLQFKPGTYSLFMIDRSGEIDDGHPGLNGQGHHSMYLMKENSGKYHTFLLRNVNFQEVTISEDSKIKWQLTGGVLDLNFFLGDSPESAVEKYHQYIGGWSLPAFWHLGYHQNKWAGCKSLEDLKFVLENFEAKQIPLDALWTDAEHMKDKINFSIDEKQFPLDEVTKVFQEHNKRWIPLMNSHISLPNNQPPVSTYPNLENLYMKNSLGTLCDGSFLWGKVNFIDFLHPECKQFWQKMLDHVYQKWPFSGVWLDANEVSNLEEKNAQFLEKAQTRKYYDLPFYPGGKNFYELRIVDVDCIHHNKQEEYDVRVFNALFQTKYTFEALQNKSPFPFVLSRATLFGGARYASTWIPDARSDWESLKISLADLLNHGIFGYAMAGVDICGFVGRSQTNPELCTRWHQLAVFYPFARNSHILQTQEVNNNQEPYTYSDFYFTSILNAIRLRYAILKQLYTMFFMKKDHHQGEKKIGTLLRPLFFDYHNDTSLPPYGSPVHEQQFLVGDSIMVAPLLYDRTSYMDVYFPNRRWFDLRNYQEIPVRGGMHGFVVTITEPIPYFLQGGHLIFTQTVDGQNVKSTEDLNNIFTTIIALNDEYYAEGNVLLASNYSEHYIYDHCVKQNCLLKLSTQLRKSENETVYSLTLIATTSHPGDDQIRINKIKLMGAPPDFAKRFKKATFSDNSDRPIKVEKSPVGMIQLSFSELDIHAHNNNTSYEIIFDL